MTIEEIKREVEKFRKNEKETFEFAFDFLNKAKKILENDEEASYIACESIIITNIKAFSLHHEFENGYKIDSRYTIDHGFESLITNFNGETQEVYETFDQMCDGHLRLCLKYFPDFAKRISRLDTGAIIWNGEEIIGVVGMTLPYEYYGCKAKKIMGSIYDYELITE